MIDHLKCLLFYTVWSPSFIVSEYAALSLDVSDTITVSETIKLSSADGNIQEYIVEMHIKHP